METKEEIANFVRHQCESWAVQNGFWKELDCMCAIASHALAYLFRKYQFDAILVEGEFAVDPDMKWGDGHCWVESDEKIWDITASQFDVKLPHILQTSIDDPRYRKEICHFLASQLSGWPIEQKPSLRKTKQILTEKRKMT